MHANASYTIVATKAEREELDKMAEVLAGSLSDDFEGENRETFLGSRKCQIDGTYRVVWLEDIVDLCARMAKSALNCEFSVSGTVDCSETSGEFMDFSISYQNRMLTVSSSEWYYEVWLGEFESYSEYLDEYGDDSDCISEDDFERLMENEFCFRLEDENNSYVDVVPLSNVEYVFLDGEGNVIDAPAWKSEEASE